MTSEPLLPLDLPQTESERLWPTPNTLDGMRGRTPEQLEKTKLNGHWGKGLNTGCLKDAVLMSSAAASPARTSPRLARGRALMESVPASGPKWRELLARYDPATQSWRTSQLCLDGDLAEFSETWPRSGTMRNGTAYQLPPLVPLTDVTASGLWPTPHGFSQDGRSNGPSGNELGRAVNQAMWPTPTSRDWRSGKNINCWDNARPLSEVIGGSLNPTWVEWLMGFPIGWTDLEP